MRRTPLAMELRHICSNAEVPRALFLQWFCLIARIIRQCILHCAALQSASCRLTPCDNALFGTYVVLEEPRVSNTKLSSSTVTNTKPHLVQNTT
jgi:hypothetical protein